MPEHFSQKYTIVSFIHPVDDQYSFSSKQWPPHVTLAAVFSITQEVSELVAAIKTMAQATQPFTVSIIGEDFFGPKKDIHVALIDTMPDLIHLHQNIIHLLHEAGAVFNEPRYILEGYRPHITLHGDASSTVNEPITVRSVALIDMFPDKDPHKRQVISMLSFNS